MRNWLQRVSGKDRAGLGHGFTIVELIVIISVIAVITAIAIIGFSRYQADGRDARRAASVSVIAEALEKYYDEHGEYPSCPNVTAGLDTVTTNTLLGVDKNSLIAPGSTNTSLSSLRCATLTTTSEDFFEYGGDGSAACATGASCLSYTLRYKDEGSNAISSVQSRRNTSVATSGAPTLSRNTATYTTIPFSWTTPDNVVNFTLERKQSTSCSDFSGASQTIVTGSSITVTGLTQDTDYCFRIIGNASGNQQTNPSNVISVTTRLLAAPAPFIENVTNNSLSVSWPAVSGATTYELEESTGSFSNTPTVTGITGTTNPRTGLTTGTAYNYQVRAVTTDNSTRVESAWSSLVIGTPLLPSPTGVTSAMSGDFGASTHAASCSMGSPQFSRSTTYQTSGSTADNWGSWSAWQTSTSFPATFIAEGMYGKVRVKAMCISGNAESLEVISPTVDKRRPITSISAGTWYNRQTSPALVAVGGGCVGGTTEMYKWGEIYHGSAGYHGGGGWGQWGDFEITNGPPNWSMNDGLNAYRISRTICNTPYWTRSLISAVPGGTLQGGGATNYNNFVNAGYNYSASR